ncbi:MAG: protein kinase [Myxococcota bacterium]
MASPPPHAPRAVEDVEEELKSAPPSDSSEGGPARANGVVPETSEAPPEDRTVAPVSLGELGPELGEATELSDVSSPFDAPIVDLDLDVPVVASGASPSRAASKPPRASLGTSAPPDPDFVAPDDGGSAPAPAQRRSLRGKVIAGKYRIEGAIARGGMGQVYLATQMPLGRKVAIKIVMQQPGDAAFRERFFLEASTCARLAHANIVVIYDYGETDEGDLFTVMEYLGRRSLAGTIRHERCLSPLRACSVALQIGRALRAAHRAGVVHRDLKPSNVMLIEDPEGASDFDFVKVVDFGLAKVFEGAEAAMARLTRADMLLGSPRYMSPEQVRNRSIDPRSDIYSFGVILYHMLTGRPPFDGGHPSEILAQQLRDPPPAFEDVAPDVLIPHQLESLVHRCLEKDPNDRHSRIEDVLFELKQIFVLLGGDVPNLSLHADHSLGSSTLPASAALMTSTTQPGYASDPSNEGPLVSDNVASRWASPWWAAVVILSAVVASLAFWVYVLD